MLRVNSAIAASFAFLASAAISQAAIIVNEVDYDQPSTDTLEFIELYNPDSTPESLNGLSLVLFNGSNTTNPAYTTLAFPANASIPAGGYYVIGSTNILTADLNFAGGQDQIQNGAPDALGIYSGVAPANATNTNLVPGTGISYEGSNSGTPTNFTIVAALDSDGTLPATSMSRIPNGSGNFTLGVTTMGAANQAVPEPTSLALLAAAGMIALRRRSR